MLLDARVGSEADSVGGENIGAPRRRESQRRPEVVHRTLRVPQRPAHSSAEMIDVVQGYRAGRGRFQCERRHPKRVGKAPLLLVEQRELGVYRGQFRRPQETAQPVRLQLRRLRARKVSRASRFTPSISQPVISRSGVSWSIDDVMASSISGLAVAACP